MASIKCVCALVLGAATVHAVAPSPIAVVLESATAALRRVLPRDVTAPASTAAGVANVTVMLPMRDGVKLNTVVYLPAEAGASLGTILMRTPYGVSGLAPLAEQYASIGWACVTQDERGRYGSEGNYTMWRTAANDAWDTMAAIAAQPWSNGRVAATGTSANAIEAYVQPLALPGPPPQLSSQFLIVGMAVMHEMTFQGGAYREALVSGWLTNLGEPGEIAVVQANEAWSDYYNSTSLDDGSPAGRWRLVDWPVLHLAGWYDIFSTTQYHTYQNILAYGGPGAVNDQFFIMGPGGHCAGGAIAWPNASWGTDLAQTFSITLFNATIGAPSTPLEAWDGGAFAARLDRVRALAAATPAIWYVLGPGSFLSLGNFWVADTAFPNPALTPYFLSAGGTLSLSPPTSSGSLNFTADPSNPIPTYGGNNLIIQPCGPQDQNHINYTAGSVAQWTSEPLAADVALTGIITATLFVASTANDTDIVVKVTDVFPTGEDMLVQDGILRMRWRAGSFAPSPSLMTPGEVYQVTVEVGAMAYIFNALHRIRITVAGSNAPRFSVNPNTGVPVNATSAGVRAITTVLADAQHPSSLNLPVLPLASLLARRLE